MRVLPEGKEKDHYHILPLCTSALWTIFSSALWPYTRIDEAAVY